MFTDVSLALVVVVGVDIGDVVVALVVFPVLISLVDFCCWMFGITD